MYSLLQWGQARSQIDAVSMSIDSGGYNLDVDQTDNNQDRTYSLTGICNNANGCSVTVTQN